MVPDNNRLAQIHSAASTRERSPAIICINVLTNPSSHTRDYLLKDIRIPEVNAEAGNVIIVDPKIKGEAVIVGETRDGHASGGAVGQGHRLAESAAVHIGGGAVLRVEGPVIGGAVAVVTVEVLETEGIRVVCDQLIIRHVISQIQTGDLGSREGGAVAPVLQLVVVDVGDVADVLIVLVIGGIVGIIDGNKSRRILDVYQVVFIRTVVDRDIVAAVILIIIEIILSVVVLIELVIGVVISGIIVIPRLEISAVCVIISNIISGIVVQEIRQPDIGFVIIGGGVIGCVMDGIEGLVIAVDDFGIGRVAATVVVRHIPVFVLYAACWRRVVVLGLIDGIISRMVSAH